MKRRIEVKCIGFDDRGIKYPPESPPEWFCQAYYEHTIECAYKRAAAQEVANTKPDDPAA